MTKKNGIFWFCDWRCWLAPQSVCLKFALALVLVLGSYQVPGPTQVPGRKGFAPRPTAKHKPHGPARSPLQPRAAPSARVIAARRQPRATRSEERARECLRRRQEPVAAVRKGALLELVAHVLEADRADRVRPLVAQLEVVVGVRAVAHGARWERADASITRV